MVEDTLFSTDVEESEKARNGEMSSYIGRMELCKTPSRKSYST